jgi:gamma-glutamylcysteine synthetase
MPALWVGLLYDSQSLDAAWDLVKDWTAEERQAMRDGVATHGPVRAGVYAMTTTVDEKVAGV